MLANLGDQEIEIVLVLGLWEISKHNPISKVPEGTLLTLTLGTFNCVTREVKDACGSLSLLTVSNMATLKLLRDLVRWQDIVSEYG